MKSLKAIIKIVLLLSVIYSQSIAQQQQQIPWPTLMNSPWPMIKHDPQGTGRSPYMGPKYANIIWAKNMEYGVFTGPAIDVDGNLYVGTNTWLPQDTTNYFYSIYPDGMIRWTFLTGETFSSNSGFLIGNDSTIYFASQGGYVYAVDYWGNLKWKRDYGMNIFSHVMNIDKDSSIYITSSHYDSLYSINRYSGNLNWKVSYDGGFTASSPIYSPDGHSIYISGKDSNLYALNLDGSLKWKFSCSTASSVPLVDNSGNIYIISKLDSVGLHSIHPNGTIRWSYNFANWDAVGPLLLSPTIDRNGNLYFPGPTSPQENKIISVDYYGNFRWEYSFAQLDEEIWTPFICDGDGTIYCGSTRGYYYYAISSEGELLWKLPLNNYQVDNSGAIGSDGTLYIGTHLGSLITGQEKTLIAIRDTVTSVGNENQNVIDFKLEQNYPNPFNSNTKIRYSISLSDRVMIKIFDIMGKEVATLLDRYQQAGGYEVLFQVNNLSSGIYFYTLTAGNFTATKKLILLK